MALVARLAGALVARTNDDFYLVGNTKVPCDFAASGFERPAEIHTGSQPFVRLVPRREVVLPPPALSLDVEGEELPRFLVARFVIERTGSVSERLWRLVMRESDEDTDPKPDVVSARWLGEMPASIWQIVRDAVLRCT